jgi:Niemann-Pick C1 protein
MPSCTESFGHAVESGIQGTFSSLGLVVGSKPRWTIVACLVLTVLCGGGFVRWETESRGEELWVPQDTTAEAETMQFEALYPRNSRFNTLLLQGSSSGGNVLTQDLLVEMMRVHDAIATGVATVEGAAFMLTDLCTQSGGSCDSSRAGVCQCLLTSVLRQWNFDLATLQADANVLETLQAYGSREDLEAVLGSPVFDATGALVSAQAVVLSYFLQDGAVVVDGSEEDPINEGWEEQVFLDVAESIGTTAYPTLAVDYFAARSFPDEFGDAIGGDLVLVQVSYFAAFLFLGANMGKIRCGTGSRWSMALAALVAVGISTAAGFGVSSAFGLFFGPVHSLLPFILLGIGVDDAFVIVNAFNRERTVARSAESNEMLAKRAARSLARAGASITVTSATDLVAFAISSSSGLPALASFCAYASICIFFLWIFASTFFSACMVLDERRQRDNRRECLCCLTRGKPIQEDGDDAFQEDSISRYFRNYHAPAILSRAGKVVTLVVFTGLIAFGFYGAFNLSVEDSQRNFIPDGYLADYFEAADSFFPSTGINLNIVFEGQTAIYNARQNLADLDSRLTGLSSDPPYIGEPISEEAYRNVMTGLYDYLVANGSDQIGGATLGDDSWPTTEVDFLSTIQNYASFSGPGSVYSRDLSLSESGSLQAIRVKSEYVRLTKSNNGEIIDDADRQIEAMDSTRDLLESWDDLPPSFPYSPKFIDIEGFKIIKKELFQNVVLSLLAVGLIVFFTVASPVASILITMVVGFCIVEILGFMYLLGIVIDSVSVINITLAVGLSVDYSAHIGHCFMTKQGADKNERVLEALADIGAAVLSGAMSTFLAVAVLLFSTSYVFEVLSQQFALTVGLGIIHGLVLLPVLLSIFGPAPFTRVSTEAEEVVTDKKDGDALASTNHANGSDEDK